MVNIEAKSFELAKKNTLGRTLIEITECRPNLSISFLFPLSAISWLREIVADALELMLLFSKWNMMAGRPKFKALILSNSKRRFLHIAKRF